MKKHIGFLATSFTIAAFFVMVQAPDTFAATITPTTTAQTGSGSDCTVTDALKSAETNVAVNGCAAGGGYPTVDRVQLSAGDYIVASDTPILTEAIDIEGVSPAASRITADDGQFIIDINQPANQNHPVTLRNIELYSTITTIFSIDITQSDTSNVVIDNVKYASPYAIPPELLLVVKGNTQGTISVDDLTTGKLTITQQGSAGYESNINNLIANGDTGLSISADTPNAGNTTVRHAELIAFNSGGGFGVLHYNPRLNARLTVLDSVIKDYGVGLGNQECSGSVSVGSLYVTNSSIGGSQMTEGIENLCGHVVVNNSTFYDISGSALVLSTNYTDGVNVVNGTTTEVYNSTFTGIQPTSSFPGIFYLKEDESIPAQRLSTLILHHNTFARNTLGSYANIAMKSSGSIDLDTFDVRNSAFEGKPISGSYGANTNTIKNNLTTSTAQTGIGHVSDFVLGPLEDNGGTATGVNGRLGNVLTMRPLAASPLVDAAPYAGLNIDQRNGSRSLLAAYDVGSVEITMAEYVADGGIWPRPTAPNTGVGIPATSGIMLAAIGAVVVAGSVVLVRRTVLLKK